MAININPGTPLRHVATINATGNWTAPAGTNIAFVSIHGATGGGAGGGWGRYNTTGGAGGTGMVSGAFVQVTGGAAHAVTIGAGGAGGPGSAGQGGGSGGGAAGVTNFDSALTVPGSGGGTAGVPGAAGSAASSGSGTTNLTSLSPSGALTRVATITNQTTGALAAGNAGSKFTASRYGSGDAGGTGASGQVHVYI